MSKRISAPLIDASQIVERHITEMDGEIAKLIPVETRLRADLIQARQAGDEFWAELTAGDIIRLETHIKKIRESQNLLRRAASMAAEVISSRGDTATQHNGILEH